MKRNSDTILWALLLILCAAYLITSQMGLAPTLHGIGLFDLLLSFFFVSMLIKGLLRRSFGRIFFSVAFLGIIYDEVLGITAITPWTVLIAALLLTIALNLLFPKSHQKWHSAQHTEFGSSVDTCTGENLSFHVTFGEASKYVNSDNFIHANCSSNFGELNVYLDNALIQGSSASIDLSVKFGEMCLYVPKTWRVNCNVSKAFGDITEKGHCLAGEDAKVLHLNGDVGFGELKIIYI